VFKQYQRFLLSSDLLDTSSAVLLFQSLLLDEFSIAQFHKLPLLFTQVAQFFFLHDFHQGLFDGLADQYLKNGLHFNIEVKQLQQNRIKS